MRAAFFFLASLTISWALLAQPDFRTPTIQFQHFLDGMSNGNASSFAQDPYGYVWIGTVGGLNRFDGEDYRIFRYAMDDDRSLPDNRVNDLYVDRTGDLWVATFHNLARYRYETEDFTHYAKRDSLEYPDIDALTIAEDGEGRLWLGTLHGLYLVDRETKDVVRWTKGGFQQFKERRIQDIWIDDQGAWLACWDGLYYSNDLYGGQVSKATFGSDGPVDADIRNMTVDHQGSLWLATEKEGLWRIDDPLGDAPEIQQYLPDESRASLGDNKVFDVFCDSQHRIWAGTEQAGLKLYLPDLDGFASFQKDLHQPFALRTNSIWRAFEDRDGRLWFGSNNQGFFVHDPWMSKFGHITQGTEANARLKSNTVTSFLEQGTTLWIGTDGGGVSIWDRVSGEFEFVNHDPQRPGTLGSDAVLCLFEDSKSRIWAGTWDGGLNLFNSQDETFTTLRHTEHQPSIASNNIFAIDEDANGNLWLATWGNGLTRYNPESGHIFHLKHVKYSDEFLTDALTYDVHVDHLNGDVWVATVFGVDRVRMAADDSYEIFHYRNDVEAPYKISHWYGKTIFQDSKDRIWLGTLNGLNLYDRSSETFEVFYRSHGLSGDDIMSIEEDEEGALWVSTDNGITRMWEEDSTWHFEAFDEADGLQGKEFFRSASLRTEDGELLFGGVNGFNVFHPAEVMPYDREAPIQLTSLRIFDREVSISSTNGTLRTAINTAEHISLTHDQNIFSLGFGAVNFTHPAQQQFAYKLEGLEERWNYVGDQRTATYTNLEPGDYTFLVKAANHDDVWSQTPRALHIKVLPPWWRTWWAKILIYAGAVLFIALSFRVRLASIRKQKRNLQEQVDQRTKEVLRQQEVLRHQAQRLQESNDQKNKLFSIIAHDLRGPLAALQGITELLDPEILEAEDLQLARKEIHKRVRGIGGIMNNLLDWARGQMEGEVSKVDACHLLPMAEEVFQGYQASADEKNIALSFQVSKMCAAYADPDQLRLILRNLVSNAIKFTPEGGEVSLSCSPRGDEMMCISVTDSGIGIPPAKLSSVFDHHTSSTRGTSGEKGVGLGLLLVKEYVEKNGGEVWVKSKVGEGSTFSFTLKLARVAAYTGQHAHA